MKQIFFLCSLLILCGCATTWRDPKNNADSTSMAILILEKPVASGLIIEKIDGKRRGLGSFTRYELSPDEHTLTVALNEAFKIGGKLYVHFTPKPGQTYHIEKSVDEKNHFWRVWVTEDSTGQKFYGEVIKP